MHAGLLHQASLDQVVGLHDEHIAVAVLDHHACHWHQQRRAFARFNGAAREHAGAGVAAGDIDIGDAGAIVDLHGGRHCAHLALERAAIDGRDLDGLAHLDARQLRLRHLGAPFHAVLAQHAQHFLAGLRDLAHAYGARGDGAAVGRGDRRVAHTQLCSVQIHACGLDARLGGNLVGLQPVEVGSGQRA